MDWNGDYYGGFAAVDGSVGGDNIAHLLRNAFKKFYELKADKHKYTRKTVMDETDDESYILFNGTLPSC